MVFPSIFIAILVQIINTGFLFQLKLFMLIIQQERLSSETGNLGLQYALPMRFMQMGNSSVDFKIWKPQ